MASKADEFDAVMDRLRDVHDDASAREASIAAMLFLAQNRDLFSRGLRLVEIIEDDEKSDRMRRSIASQTAHWDCAGRALIALREAVK